jgi:N utilization substance protein B
MLFAFAACGDKEKATPTDAEVTDTQADGTTAPETTEGEKNEPAKAEPVVLLDNEYLTFTINEVYVDEDDYYTLKATFENNAEKNYSYFIDPSSINGISVMNYLYAEVSAGKKAIEEINFEDSILRNNGVGEYTDIEMTVQVCSEDELFEEPVAEYTVHYYPLGEDKAVKYERQPAATDKVLLDNEYVTVTAIGFTHDEELESTDLNLYVVNKSDEKIALGSESCTVNDIMVEVYFAEEIPAGKVAFSCISFDDEELKDKYIEEVYFGVLAHRDELDAMLDKHAKGWKVSRMSRVSRSVLRLAAYEILFMRKQIPIRVSINEAIELSKKFDNEKAKGFINGILNAVKNDVMNPEKAEEAPAVDTAPAEAETPAVETTES